MKLLVGLLLCMLGHLQRLQGSVTAKLHLFYIYIYMLEILESGIGTGFWVCGLGYQTANGNTNLKICIVAAFGKSPLTVSMLNIELAGKTIIFAASSDYGKQRVNFISKYL